MKIVAILSSSICKTQLPELCEEHKFDNNLNFPAIDSHFLFNGEAN